jgi:hypothetical protein
MLTHATDCRNAQCPPIAQTSENTTRTWAIFVRTSVGTILEERAEVKQEPATTGTRPLRIGKSVRGSRVLSVMVLVLTLNVLTGGPTLMKLFLN